MAETPPDDLRTRVIAAIWADGLGPVMSPEDLADRALSAVADHFAACRRCGREHRERDISTKPNVHQSTWADPQDGHAYAARDRDTADTIRRAIHLERS